MADKRHWTESLGVHRLDETLEVAERLAKTYECNSPAGGLGPGTHCAACCYGTGIEATSMDEFETAKVLLAVPSLVAEIKRLRELVGERCRDCGGPLDAEGHHASEWADCARD